MAYLCAMRHFAASVLLAIVLLAGTPLGEMVKLPILVHHYIVHINLNPEMDFGQFFSMHYNDGLIIDEDYHQDMQLPFKSIPLNFYFAMDYIDVRPLMMLNVWKVANIKVKLPHLAEYFTSQYLSSIWQPPRLA